MVDRANWEVKFLELRAKLWILTSKKGTWAGEPRYPNKTLSFGQRLEVAGLITCGTRDQGNERVRVHVFLHELHAAIAERDVAAA